MNISLTKATIKEKLIFERLFELYVYEFSKYIESIQIREDGTYGFDKLNNYFTDSKYHCYLVKVDNLLAGFAIVKENNQNQQSFFSIDEFFIVKKGKGIGTFVAHQLFNQFKGTWIITQSKNNYPAQAFWRKTITEYTNNSHSEHYDQARRSVQEFVS
ncbi:GNAT family N-acetyltransferase [Litchfieldia alkalitelluris]|uniref:GNAT family N-acetyltransferase n=1 Tax=Litchfieldia alkalitelluris TaxID=304268 RepID=UPI00099849E5|nr:GNAT family N-acetyltransferase [Litchfieldia alkalitelluris]